MLDVKFMFHFSVGPTIMPVQQTNGQNALIILKTLHRLPESETNIYLVPGLEFSGF